MLTHAIDKRQTETKPRATMNRKELQRFSNEALAPLAKESTLVASILRERMAQARAMEKERGRRTVATTIISNRKVR